MNEIKPVFIIYIFIYDNKIITNYLKLSGLGNKYSQDENN